MLGRHEDDGIEAPGRVGPRVGVALGRIGLVDDQEHPRSPPAKKGRELFVLGRDRHGIDEEKDEVGALDRSQAFRDD